MYTAVRATALQPPGFEPKTGGQKNAPYPILFVALLARFVGKFYMFVRLQKIIDQYQHVNTWPAICVSYGALVMHERGPAMRCVKLLGAAALIGIALLSGRAHATAVTYTFSGSGGGSVDGNDFNGAFTFVFTGDTTAIDTSGAPFYRYDNIGGTFSEGSTTVTLAPTVTIVATADSATPRINFFNQNFNNGLGINDPSLATYALSTSFGPLTVTSP